MAMLKRTTQVTMAAATGLAVANIYYNQPMLGIIQHEFADSNAAAWIPTLTQVGYAIGLVALLPLGDLLERRRLIVLQFVLLAGALALAAIAPGAAALAAASLLVGLVSTVAQQIIPVATILSPPEKRGQVIGTIMSGLLLGILFSRTLAGFVATHLGWREMFWVAVPLALLGAVAMQLALPRHQTPPERRQRYGVLLRSVLTLWWDEPLLKWSSIKQGLLFASFVAFWTTLALRLEQPDLHLGADVAGLFGVIGAVGVFGASLSGRIADRSGPQRVITTGMVLVLASWILFATLSSSLIALVAGVIVFDLGVQIAMVSHQQIVFGINPDARSRVNAAYMTTLFVGGAIGSFAAGLAWHHGGWIAVALTGCALAACSLALQLAIGMRGVAASRRSEA